MRYSTILALIILIGLTHCKKDIDVEKNMTQEGTASITIINKVSDSVFIDMSGHDIATGTIPHVFNTAIAPGDSITIPHTDLKHSFRYNYEWYTKDYSASNWYIFSNGLPVQYSVDYYKDSSDYFVEINGSKRNDLQICLNGDGLFSYWTAVDAYDNNGASVWSNLADYEQVHKFTISRFYTVKHQYKKFTNKDTSVQVGFALQDTSSNFWLHTKLIDSFILTNDLSIVAPLQSSAVDTLFYSKYFRDSSGTIHVQPPHYKIARTSVEK